MEREKFEQSWKHAFEEAEITPSEKVWTHIELDLEKSKGGELKRRLLFYQMLAAASVVLAMAIGGAGYYYTFRSDSDASGKLAHNETLGQPSSLETSPSGSEPLEEMARPDDGVDRSSNVVSDGAIADNTTGELPGRKSSKTITTNQSADVPSKITSSTDGDDILNASSLLVADRHANGPALPVEIKDDHLPPLHVSRDVKLNFAKEEPEVDPVLAMLAMLEQREREVQNEDDRKKSDAMKNENLWTSIGFAAGSFNAVQAPSASAGPGTLNSMTLAAPIVDQESKASGYSYSMGVNVGTRIAERWVLQGGVNYLTQSSEYTANSLVADGPGFLATERYKPMTTNDVVNANETELASRIVYSAPYSVNNSMRYLSIPMQAGYLLVNNTFGLQLNAGVATDLFLRNTVKGESDQLASATQSGGADSPYRTVNLSGLVGTEFSYRFGPHYRISLNPGLRYPLNTIYKSELGVQSSPLTFDVGLRFRYIFH